MSRKQPVLSLLVLTEDSAASAHDVVVALTRKMLWLLDPGYRRDLVEFRPADGASRKVAQGNLWKSRKPRDRARIVLLGRVIAARLLQEDVPGFVLFHIDGDVPWSRHEDSENVERFEGFIRDYVRPALDHALRTQQKDRGESWPDEQMDGAMQAALLRLLLLVPFYSVEAWLYQNTEVARRLCAEACGRHLELIGEWEADPGLLDEIEQPKKRICLGDGPRSAEHHRALAEHAFPADRAFAAGKSFAATVTRLLGSDDLCAALERTHEHH
ncbi:MAG TPA: hypothetical protein VLS89_21120 [Candidatus Nanopelagicales bacterium]|nr:hypothetical protein [Candidatus Nanopelagicales bacterium]